MQNIILFDTTGIHQEFLPLTFTRPVSDIRIGIFTIREKWESRLPGIYSYDTADYLTVKYPMNIASNSFFIAGNVRMRNWSQPFLLCRSVNLFFTEMS